MDAIVAYLDTMFAPYPQTPRLVEARTELRSMMEDKYTELLAEGHSPNEAVGQVITEFGNLDELAPVLGIATDLHTGNAAPEAGAEAEAGDEAPARTLTLEAAEAYTEARRRTQPRLAAACAALVASPACLVALAADANYRGPWGTQPVGTLIGLLILLAIAAPACAALVTYSRTLAPFRWLKEGPLLPTPEAAMWTDSLRTAHEPARTRGLSASIALWILSAVPVLTAGVLSDEGGPWPAWAAQFGVACTLLIAAVGVDIAVRSSWATSAARVLSGTAHRYAPRDARGFRDGNASQLNVTSVVAGVYWPVLTAVFLLWGFGWNGWNRAWVLWPVGAVFFGAVSAITGAWDHRRRKDRV